MDFAKKHPLISTVVSIIIIGLPQYIDSVWSLAERVTGKDIAMPNITWAYWITVPLGLLMFGVVLYYLRIQRKFTFDYAYGLALTGLHFGYDDSKNPPSVQLGLVLANATEYPIKYEVEQFEVVLENRAIEQPKFKTRGGVVSSKMRTTFLYPPFSDELPSGSDHLEGILRFTILYGHPEIGFFRKMKRELSVTLRLGDKAGVVYLNEWESDEGIKK